MALSTRVTVDPCAAFLAIEAFDLVTVISLIASRGVQVPMPRKRVFSALLKRLAENWKRKLH